MGNGEPAMSGDDIFISYGHLDNQCLYEGADGWVTEFHRLLGIRLCELLGRRPNIYRDQKLAGNDEFADELEQRVREAALLIPVLTPAFCNSEWCMRELLAFCTAAACRNLPGHKSRIFKVLKTPVPPERQPEHIRSSLGFRFYAEHPDTGVPRELRLKINGELQQEFLDRLADLAHHLAEGLRLIDSGRTVDDGPDARKVYLAEPAADMRPEYDRVKRDLLEHGFEVLPDKELPDEVGALEAFLDETLPQCELSIHLIGRNYGVVPDGTEQSRVALQAEHAQHHAGESGLKRLVWVPAGLDIDDPRQRRMVDGLLNDPAIDHGAGDLLQASIEDLLTQVHRQLRALREQRDDAGRDDDIPSVYVICDQRDTAYIDGIADVLAEHGCQVSLPEFDADEAEFRDYNKSMLTSCDAAIVYYKSANRQWLEQKLQDLRRLPALGRSQPLRSTEILVNPPRTWHGRFPHAHVVQSANHDVQYAVQPVLADLGRLQPA